MRIYFAEKLLKHQMELFVLFDIEIICFDETNNFNFSTLLCGSTNTLQTIREHSYIESRKTWSVIVEKISFRGGHIQRNWLRNPSPKVDGTTESEFPWLDPTKARFTVGSEIPYCQLDAYYSSSCAAHRVYSAIRKVGGSIWTTL